MERQTCRRRVLGSSDFTLIEQCTCGSVHVTIGAVTLRLAASALTPLALTLSEAARTLTFDQALGHPGVPHGVVA